MHMAATMLPCPLAHCNGSGLRSLGNRYVSQIGQLRKDISLVISVLGKEPLRTPFLSIIMLSCLSCLVLSSTPYLRGTAVSSSPVVTPYRVQSVLESGVLNRAWFDPRRTQLGRWWISTLSTFSWTPVSKLLLCSSCSEALAKDHFWTSNLHEGLVETSAWTLHVCRVQMSASIIMTTASSLNTFQSVHVPCIFHDH